MNKMIALGKSEFILGFRLAGIRSIEAQHPKEDFEKYTSDPDIGIIITDEETISQLSSLHRDAVEARVRPVTVVVSATASSNESLRKKIKKAIGVDLWNQ